MRRAILAFQRIVSTRNDLGTLASLHNKFVRLALVRLRLSMEERLGDLPPEVEAVYQETIRPDPGERSRLILPTRPTMLGRGERVRLLAIAQGPVALHTRPLGSREWTTTPAKLLGRRTYEAWLGPFDPAAGLVEYYCSSGRLASPACWVTLIAG